MIQMLNIIAVVLMFVLSDDNYSKPLLLSDAILISFYWFMDRGFLIKEITDCYAQQGKHYAN